MIENEKNKDIRNMLDTLKYLKESVTTDFGKYSINTYEPQDNTADQDFLNEHTQEIWDFMNAGYNAAGEGNFYGCMKMKDLKKNANLFKIAFSESGEWIAVSVYTGYQFGKKCIGITATVNSELRRLGKEAVNRIIQEDATHPLEFYWCECSDVIAHLFEKYGGIPIRNEFVNCYINKNVVPSSWLNDEYHYTRKLSNGKEVTKMIYGFNRQETFDKVYAKYKEELDRYLTASKDRTLTEGYELYSIDYALDILGDFYLMSYELGFNEYPQYYLDIIHHCFLQIKMVPNKTEEIERSIMLINDYLPYVTPLECHHYVGNQSIYKDNTVAMVAENKK